MTVTPKTSRDLSDLGGSPLGQILTEVRSSEWKAFFNEYLQFNGDLEKVSSPWIANLLIVSVDLVRQAKDDDPLKFLPKLFRRKDGDKLKQAIRNAPDSWIYEEIL